MYKHAVILAGGKGLRLLPLTANIPKPMVQVAGFPFLYWQLRHLKDQGVTDVLLLVSHLAHVIRDYFGQHSIAGLNIRFSLETEPMGTGGALFHARSDLPEKFWLLNGDSFVNIQLEQMAQLADAHKWTACMAVANREQATGTANLRIEKGVVAAYIKEGSNNETLTAIDAGVYLLTRSVIEKGPTGKFDLGALWPSLIVQGQLGAFPVHEKFFDIGTPGRLAIFAEQVHKYF